MRQLCVRRQFGRQRPKSSFDLRQLRAARQFRAPAFRPGISVKFHPAGSATLFGSFADCAKMRRPPAGRQRPQKQLRRSRQLCAAAAQLRAPAPRPSFGRRARSAAAASPAPRPAAAASAPLAKRQLRRRPRAGSRQVCAANPCKHWPSETSAPQITPSIAAVCFDVVRSQDLAAGPACTGSAREVERMQTSNARPTDRPQQHRSAGRQPRPPQLRITAAPGFRRSAAPPHRRTAAPQHRSCRRTAVSSFPPHRRTAP